MQAPAPDTGSSEKVVDVQTGRQVSLFAAETEEAPKAELVSQPRPKAVVVAVAPRSVSPKKWFGRVEKRHHASGLGGASQCPA